MHKPWEEAAIRFCLTYPEIYEVGEAAGRAGCAQWPGEEGGPAGRPPGPPWCCPGQIAMSAWDAGQCTPLELAASTMDCYLSSFRYTFDAAPYSQDHLCHAFLPFPLLSSPAIPSPAWRLGHTTAPHSKILSPASLPSSPSSPAPFPRKPLPGASNLGHIILYTVLNASPSLLCDRSYFPAHDMQQVGTGRGGAGHAAGGDREGGAGHAAGGDRKGSQVLGTRGGGSGSGKGGEGRTMQCRHTTCSRWGGGRCTAGQVYGSAGSTAS